MTAEDLGLTRNARARQIPFVVLAELGCHSRELASIPGVQRALEDLDLALLIHGGTVRVIAFAVLSGETRIELRPAELGDHGWVLERHAYLFEDEEGWGQPFIAMIARLIADYLQDPDPEREAAWVAEPRRRKRVGSVYCVRRSDEVAQLRLLFVDAEARGHRVGSKLVERCIEFARERGYQRMMLSTVSPLESARRIYDAAGSRRRRRSLTPRSRAGTVRARRCGSDL